MSEASPHFRRPAPALLHVFGLWGFWVAEPLFSLLRANPTFLVAHGVAGIEVAAFAAALVALGPLLLAAAPCALLWLIPTRTTVGWAAHCAIVGLLWSAMALLFARDFADGALGTAGSLAIAAATGCVLGALAFWSARWNTLQTWMGVAALAFPVLFVARSPLLRAADAPDAAAAIASDTPVVLVVLDEFPLASLLDVRGRIDRERLPHFAAFADDAVWFREASAVASDTNVAVPAILTGRYPSDPGPPVLASYPENLFTFLRGSGDVVAFEDITRMCPDDVCDAQLARGPARERFAQLGLDTGIVYLHRVVPGAAANALPAIDGSWAGFLDAGDVTPAPATSDANARYRGRLASFGRLLDAIRREGERDERTTRLFFAHLQVPHAPWNHLPSGRAYVPVEMFPRGFAANEVPANPVLAAQGLQRHLLQVGFADRIVGDLVATLREAGLYDDALVVLASDHGASFAPGQRRRYLTDENFADLLSVPLFVKRPGDAQAGIRSEPVETIDILPTIADVLGAPLPWPVDGRSLFATGEPRRDVHAHHGSLERYSPAAIAAGRARAVAFIHGLFAVPEGGLELARWGPRPDLLGRDVDALLRVPKQEPRKVSLRRPDAYRDVDASASTLPLLVEGRLAPPPGGESIPLAVAVGNTVEATTVSEPGSGHFAALLPEDALAHGENRVRILRIAGRPGRTGLVELERADVRVALELDDAGEWLVLGDARIRVEAGAVVGGAEIDDAGLTGFAARADREAAADEVLLFVGRRLAFRGAPGGLPDLVATPGASFRIALPPEWLAPGGPPLRLVAVSQGRAGALQLRRRSERERERD